MILREFIAVAAFIVLIASALAQTVFTGPYEQTDPPQAGSASCTQSSANVLDCTFSPSLAVLALPIITATPFTVSKPVSYDELIGTLAVSNGPITALTIVSGDNGNPTLSPPGYFNIWPATLHLRTSGAEGTPPPALPPSGTYSLMITATNANGTGPAALIMVVVP